MTAAYTAQDPYAALPDPHQQPGFYRDVPLKRLLAFFVDLGIIFALSVLLALFTLGIGFFVFFGLFAIVGFTYRVLSIAMGSATWGMALMSIELRSNRGEKLTLWEAFLHTAAFYLSFGVFPVQVISIAMMLFTPRGQSLTDMVFGTVALNRRARN